MSSKIKEDMQSFPKVTVRAQETELTRIEAVRARLDTGLVEGLKQMSVGPIRQDYPMFMHMSNKHGNHKTFDVLRVILMVTSN